MLGLNKSIRAEIVSQALAVVDIVPEKVVQKLIDLLESDQQLTISKLNRLTGLTGLPLEAVSNFVFHSETSRETLLIILETAVTIRTYLMENMDKCDLIWTGPIQFPIPARSTIAIIQEMLSSAQERITIVGYRIEEYAEPIIRSLSSCSDKGIDVRLVIDKPETQVRVLKKHWKAKTAPRIYTRQILESDPMASIHAKMVIIDAADLLITSANLTYHGLSSNLEIGVRVRGKIAYKAESLINELIRSKTLVAV